MFAAIIKGSNGFYYCMDGKFYDVHFPLPWAIERRNISCMDCEKYGEINGVFVAYCEQCTRIVHKGTRGFYDVDAPRKINLKNFEYMKGVCESDIGEGVIEKEEGVIEESEGVIEEGVCSDMVSPLDAVSEYNKDEDKEKEKECELIFPKIEEAIMLGKITVRERLFNTIHMCTNN